jgi:hypothetical protein
LKLSVGLVNSTPFWDELLNQVGVSVKKIEVDELSNQTYPVLILNEIKDGQKNVIHNYLTSGGYIITESLIAKKLFNIPYKRKKIKYLYPQNDDLFNFRIYSDIDNDLLIPSKANYLADQDGKNTVLFKNIEQGILVVLPDGLLSLIFSDKVKRKRFYSRWGNDLLTERASKVDKGGIYHILYRVLEFLFHKKNLPFIRLWQFPNGYESIFGFRVDTDFADDDDILNLYKTFTKNKIQATWFVETLSRQKNCKIFKGFSKQEIGLHCFHHKLYSDKESNLNDIKKGLKTLEDNGLYPNGYASPFGEWNGSLGKAVEKFQFNYSSEFGYIYDSLPLHPLINGMRTDVLQIPIHPVSVGRLNIAGHREEDMIKYYADIIEQKKKEYEPIIFYTHPSQKRLKVFENIFNIINDSRIVSLTFNDYATWWEKREKVNWQPEIDGNKILINSNEKDESFWVHTSFKNGKNYLASVTTNNLLSVKEIKPKQLYLFPGFNPDLINKKSLKIFKQEVIYNYRKLKH